MQPSNVPAYQNGQTGQPGGNGSSYPNTGYANGSSGCNGGEYDQDYGLGGYFDENGSGTQWFGSISGLIMTRDNPDFTALSRFNLIRREHTRTIPRPM